MQRSKLNVCHHGQWLSPIKNLRTAQRNFCFFDFLLQVSDMLHHTFHDLEMQGQACHHRGGCDYRTQVACGTTTSQSKRSTLVVGVACSVAVLVGLLSRLGNATSNDSSQLWTSTLPNVATVRSTMAPVPDRSQSSANVVRYARPVASSMNFGTGQHPTPHEGDIAEVLYETAPVDSVQVCPAWILSTNFKSLSNMWLLT